MNALEQSQAPTKPYADFTMRVFFYEKNSTKNPFVVFFNLLFGIALKSSAIV
jgi:hypothetical protein